MTRERHTRYDKRERHTRLIISIEAESSDIRRERQTWFWYKKREADLVHHKHMYVLSPCPVLQATFVVRNYQLIPKGDCKFSIFVPTDFHSQLHKPALNFQSIFVPTDSQCTSWVHWNQLTLIIREAYMGINHSRSAHGYKSFAERTWVTNWYHLTLYPKQTSDKQTSTCFMSDTDKLLY